MVKHILAVLKVVGILVVLTLVGLEILCRVVFPNPFTYEQEIATTLEKPERLFPANTTLTFNIQGLYEGADTVTLRVSDNRLIQPEGDRAAPYQVLFLGGSTTEAMYMHEDQRWVALLNGGDLATYNGGQAGAGVIDKYQSFKYLTDHGMKFDLVVVMTTVNDLSWLLRFHRYGLDVRLAQYRDGLYDWFTENQAAEQTVWDRVGSYSRFVWVTNTYLREHRSSFRVVDDLIRQGGAMFDYRGELASLDECGVVQDVPLDELTRTYAEDAQVNLGLLADAVHASGAQFLVMSEATSYLAPSSSFYIDLRYPKLSCTNNWMLSHEGMDALMDMLAKSYLEAGCQVGAQIYDLRTAITPYTDGPEGGRYIYDDVHYTPKGSAVVADLVRPVVEALMNGQPVSACAA